jgi:hypothetical protein
MREILNSFLLNVDSWAMVLLTLVLAVIAGVQIYRETAKAKLEIATLVFAGNPAASFDEIFYDSSILKFTFKSGVPYTESSRSFNKYGFSEEQYKMLGLMSPEYRSKMEMVEIKILNNSTKNLLHFKYPVFRLYKKWGPFKFRYTVKTIVPLSVNTSKDDLTLDHGESTTLYYPSFYFLRSLNYAAESLPLRVARTLRHIRLLTKSQKKYLIRKSEIHYSLRNHEPDPTGSKIWLNNPNRFNGRYTVKIGIEKIFNNHRRKYTWGPERVLERNQTSFLKNEREETTDKSGTLMSRYVEEFFYIVTEYLSSEGTVINNKKEILKAADLALGLAHVWVQENIIDNNHNPTKMTDKVWIAMNAILEDKKLLAYLQKNYFSTVEMDLGNTGFQMLSIESIMNEIDEDTKFNEID